MEGTSLAGLWVLSAERELGLIVGRTIFGDDEYLLVEGSKGEIILLDDVESMIFFSEKESAIKWIAENPPEEAE